MGPKDIKQDIYSVITSSRELANYCQESVKSLNGKRISDSLNNFYLKNSQDFIVNALTCEDQMFFESKDIGINNSLESKNLAIYNKVINYIQTYFLESNI